MTTGKQGQEHEGCTEKSGLKPLINSKNHRPGRELDALIAEKVFGWACVHAPIVWPREKLVQRNRDEFAREYGEQAPPAWEGDVSWEMESDYPPKMCSKCGVDDERVLFAQSKGALPKYSTDIGAAWSIVEKVDNRNPVAKEMGVLTCGLYRYDNGYTARFFNCGATAETAPLAICLAALRAFDAE